MALNFPDSPSNGQVFEGFVYNSSKVLELNSHHCHASNIICKLSAFPSS